jgi:hypothetical protein
MTLPPELSRKVLEQARLFEQAVQTLQEVQDALPAPDAEEVALLRQGGSLSGAAYLIGLLQRVIVHAENAASDLRMGVDEGMLAVVDQLRPSLVEINAIEAALEERALSTRQEPAIIGTHV